MGGSRQAGRGSGCGGKANQARCDRRLCHSQTQGTCTPASPTPHWRCAAPYAGLYRCTPASPRAQQQVTCGGLSVVRRRSPVSSGLWDLRMPNTRSVAGGGGHEKYGGCWTQVRGRWWGWRVGAHLPAVPPGLQQPPRPAATTQCGAHSMQHLRKGPAGSATCQLSNMPARQASSAASSSLSSSS